MTGKLESSRLDEAALLKQVKREKSRNKLLGNLAGNRLRGTRERVAFILNNFSATRNSDIDLAFKYWEVFHSENFSNGNINKENFAKITRYTSITRARAKIQNEFGLYQANVTSGIGDEL